ncbi:GcvT family protein [Granulosicoccus antarcticus]|uniref:4-methylaminobutanoate oxidase (Formaldehyde-forming) n=1 Tax=Granulosicoccus antarcticus IMCC3135 TaxID=1192854 RepID=A0A2Z2NSI5_9GAMM|nr:FAD-dependent oxidoreductase [Granulosicoccus antarcticus]ASJ71700.1 4-methylaminobutanoate oxidase (formaldehyde-forming) [Granulosicoccus antarcticus IMCC3135]
MSESFPSKASAVIIGGGITGASVAYHLAKLGWQDVVLLERKQFACGTTWHAAGLIGTVRANESHARLTEYSMRLLHELEVETGQSTGFRQVGSLNIAHSAARWEELRRVAAMNNAFGVTRVDTVTPEEVKALFPLIDTSGLIGGTFVEHDGKGNPIEITNAFIKGARQKGALCLEGVRVDEVLIEGGRVTGVQTDQGTIASDFVVNCGGMWARELGRKSGVNIPLHACEHYYAVTEKHELVTPDLPVLRDHDKCVYIKEDAGALLVGAFEKRAVAWGQQGIPEDFSFDELPGHMEEQLMPVLEDAMIRVPMLGDVGWRSFFCGPESFTPDDQFHVGESPEVRGYFVAAGLNSVGIQSSGGIGKVCAEWMHNGHSPMDLWGNDIRRMYPFMGTQAFAAERAEESLGLLYEKHYPFRQFETGRNARLSPVHQRMLDHNACFGQVAGWERANWFAPAGVEPKYEYSFGRQNWFDYSASEHAAARETVALFDQSSFSKYLVQGRDATNVLQRICTAQIDVSADKIVYTHWLNERGGIEADLTVTRQSENEYLVISGAATTHKDLNWLRRHIGKDEFCTVTDVTSQYAVFGVMGPNSRAMLEPLLRMDLSNEAFPFGRSVEGELGYAPIRVTRVSFVGELGWELCVPTEMAIPSFDRLWEAGQSHGLKLAGLHALDSCRIEKKFLHFGHDVADEDTPLEAGVGFVCAMDKRIPFIGQDAIARQKDSRSHMHKRLVQFVLKDPEPLFYHHEPILMGDECVGYLTSGNYGHTLGASVGLGYVKSKEEVTADWLAAQRWQIDVGGKFYEASASLRAAYDPAGLRMR